MRNLTYAIAAIIGFVGTNALLRRPSPPSLAELSTATARTGTKIWFVFDPLSCRLTPDVVSRLNGLAAGADTDFLAVMLDAPVDRKTFAQLTQAFGMRFRVVPDSEGYWRRAAQSEDMPIPFVVVRHQGRLIGMVSLLNYQSVPDAIPNAIHTLR